MSDSRDRSAAFRWLDDLGSDLRYGFRSLRRRPGLLVAALLTLGLGIGATVAMFGVLNLALFRALPYPDADRLVVGRTIWPNGTIGNMVSAYDFFDVREGVSSFESLATITPFTRDATITGVDEPERVPAAYVGPGLFRTLGVPLQLGREFNAEEGEPGAAPTILISGRYWRTRLGADPSIVGSTLTINGSPFTVVGVTRPGFRFVVDADLLAPMVRGGDMAGARQWHNWLVVGRLADGVTVDEADAEVGVIMEHLADEYPESNRDKGMRISGMQEAMVEGFRPTILMLMGAIVLVLLIACGNVASLLLARGSTRGTELAMRSALGAPRGRLIQQLLTESVPLGLAAGALGTVLALLMQHSLVAATPLTSLGLETVGLQPELLAFALLLSLGTVLVFGLAPAVMGSRVNLAEELKAGSRSVAGGRARFRSVLVIGQVALSVVLLVGAGLLVQSFTRLRSVDPGFRTESLLTAEIGLPRSEYDLEARTRFFQELLDLTRALPGVEEAGMISQLPMRDPGNNVPAWNPENPPADAAQLRAAYQRIVMPGYFDAMDIPVVSGRDVADTDADGAVPVVLINETMARTLYPDQEPLGRQLEVDEGDDTGRYEIIGVVGDVQIFSLSSEPQMVMYFSHRQRQTSVMRIAVHTAGGPGAIVGQLREVLRGLDPDIPLAGVETMKDVLSRSTSFQRTVAGAVGIFALAALLLAALGLYGVLAYQVTQRTHEIGIRVALGARAGHILRMVMGHGFALVGVGLAIGVVAALGGARAIRGRLYEVGASDPATFVGVILFFSLVALVACLLPSWRAWRVDPTVAFRAE
jgi:putative ABC transport system permease protein